MYKEGVFTKLAADCTRMARKEDSSKKLAQGINSPNSCFMFLWQSVLRIYSVYQAEAISVAFAYV